MSSAPVQISRNGPGFVLHKVKIPISTSAKTFSCWTDAAGVMEDCEGRDAKGRTVQVKKGTAQWSAVAVAARMHVERLAPTLPPVA